MRFQSMGKMGKNFNPHFLQPLPENVDRRSYNDGSRKLIPLFHDPHRKGRSSPPVVTPTLEYLLGLSSKAASSGREKKQTWIHIQVTRGL